jgi:hypothetical protein
MSPRSWQDGMAPTRSSPAISDALLYFDLRTAFANGGHKQKYQPQWLDAAFGCLANKIGNVEFQVGAAFPYRNCEATRGREILDGMSKAWIACKPMSDLLLDA